MDLLSYACVIVQYGRAMDALQKLIKDDINFLEYPCWLVDKRNDITSWIIKKDNGTYKLKSPEGMPSYFDKKVLYYLMHKLYQATRLEKYELKITRYEIAKNITPGKPNLSKRLYDNIMEALWKWKAIAIHFEGLFYESEGYTIRYFAIIDSVKLDKETGTLKINFNKEYIDQQRLSTFYKLIDFQKYKKFNGTIAARLYELLTKNFIASDTWAIGIQTLAEKITIEKRKGAKAYYPSDVLRHLRPAINEINRNTELYIVFNYNKNSQVCCFQSKEKLKQYFPAVVVEKKKKPSNEKDIEFCYQTFLNLPQDERSRIERSIDHDAILSVLSDQKSKVYSYMCNKNLWQKVV